MLDLVRCRILDQGQRVVFAAGSLWRESSLRRAQGRGTQNQHCDSGQMFSFSPNLIVRGGVKFCECKDWEYLQIQRHAASSPEASHGGKALQMFKFSCECIVHEKSHFGEGPMSASRVGSVLTQPQMVHSREKPCVCRECGKAFGRSSSFFQHHRLHGGEALLMSDVPRCL